MLISGYAELDDQRRAIQAGLRFVFKPITFAQFEATMAEIVEHAAVGKAAIPCPATLRNAGGQYATSHGGTSMTIVDLKGSLRGASVPGSREAVTAKRIEQWAAALERTEHDHPDPASRLFSAMQLRTQAAKGPYGEPEDRNRNCAHEAEALGLRWLAWERSRDWPIDLAAPTETSETRSLRALLRRPRSPRALVRQGAGGLRRRLRPQPDRSDPRSYPGAGLSRRPRADPAWRGRRPAHGPRLRDDRMPTQGPGIDRETDNVESRRS